jgi:TM2 domain-containing membrane protein YozV/RNA polymerase subunit RPABC4/transcription elongation factor Spt4
MVICPDCGREVPKAKFCKNCGAYIENIREPVQIEDSPAVPVDIVEESRDAEEIVIENPPELTKKVRYCSNCGYELGGNFNFCPNCGADLNPKVVSRERSLNVNEEKNIILAIILSVLLPGLGQIYLGLDRKGAMFLIGYVISAILIILIIGFLLCMIIWVWALVDTIMSTNALNRGEEVKDKLL